MGTRTAGPRDQRINASVNHAIAIVAVFEKFVASVRFIRLGWTVRLQGNAAKEFRFVAMPRPWRKRRLILL